MAEPLPASPAQQSQSLEVEFLRLAARWRAETGHFSAIERKVAHPCYLRIIALGSAVLPLLFVELERRPDHWFQALTALTGEDPLPRTAWGDVGQMSRIWLAWAEAHGLHVQ